jgi:hypothetical protein
LKCKHKFGGKAPEGMGSGKERDESEGKCGWIGLFAGAWISVRGMEEGRRDGKLESCEIPIQQVGCAPAPQKKIAFRHGMAPIPHGAGDRGHWDMGA